MLHRALLLVIVAAAFVFEACGPTCKNPKAPPSYAADVFPTMVQLNAESEGAAKCQFCHSRKRVGATARGAAPDEANYDTYEQMVAVHKAAAEKVQNKSMPPAVAGKPLTDAQIETFVQWSICGANP
ncbi:MAG: hypothetical protein IT381_18515 [Deltaproteobacteria bacterium]|nr:hypothetical protein [Deltaproteobacteria bacterium]